MHIRDTVTGIQHIGIPTKDLKRTIDFYESLGFCRKGVFANGASRCAFLGLGDVLVETWEEGDTADENGAINHFALATPDIDAAFKAAREEGLSIVEEGIQSIPSFWDHGIRYFNILGPNHETVEFCQIL